MFIYKKAIAILCSIVVGLIFLYSGYTKLLPVIETFEFTFIDSGMANWYTAPIMARLLIGLEIAIGLFLVACYDLKRFTIPVAVFLLLFFIVYLCIQIAINGNTGNCGCFGEHLQMTPLEAILKNIVMIVLLLPGYFWFTGWTLQKKIVMPLALVPLALGLPFFVNPIDFNYSSNNLQESVNYPLNLNLLYQPEDSSKVEIPSLELRKGKQVLAFLSLTCGHCRVAAKKFKLIKQRNPNLPIYFVLNGDKTLLTEFLEDTKTYNIPHSFCLGKTFIQLSSARLPRIYYLNNSIVVKKVDYFELSQSEIESWLNEP